MRLEPAPSPEEVQWLLCIACMPYPWPCDASALGWRGESLAIVQIEHDPATQIKAIQLCS